MSSQKEGEAVLWASGRMGVRLVQAKGWAVGEMSSTKKCTVIATGLLEIHLGSVYCECT